MKQAQFFIPVTIIAFSLSLTTLGQKPVTVEEKQINFKHGEYSGLVLTIPEVDAPNVQKEWIRKLQQSTKSDVTSDVIELSIFGAKISDIYADPINVYSKITAADSAVRLEAVFELKPKEFVSSSQNGVEYSKARAYLFEFGKSQYADLAKDDYKAQEKSLNILEQKLDNLYSSKTNLDKSLVDAKNTIAQDENEIASLKSELTTQNDELNSEKNELASLTDESAIDLKKEQIKDTEKKIKKSMDAINNDEKEILDKKSLITSAELDVSTNLKEQESVRYQIDAQKPKVQAAEKKYNNIINSSLTN
jgi:hypothetical protein